MLSKFLLIIAVGWNLCCFAEVEFTNDTLSAAGNGTVKVRATIADVTMTIEISQETSQKAMEMLSKIQSDVLDALRKNSAQDVETSTLNLYPQYHKEEQNRVIGYIASSTFSFSAPSEKAGDLIDVAVKAGANRSDSIRLRATESEMRMARLKALELAAKSAIEEGKAVMQALGLSYQGIKRIEVTPSYDSGPIYRHVPMKASFNMAESSAPSVTDQSLDVRATVTLLMEYRG